MPSAGTGSCGLDFGTSNSALGRLAGNAPRLIEVEEGRASIPTAMFFSFEDGSVTFGREAVARYVQREEGRLMRALKSVLGSSLIHESTQVGGKRIRFHEIITRFMAFLREAAGRPAAVVLGRPVRFVDDDPVADGEAEAQLRAAARQAGFAQVELQLEPIAAALDYERTVSREELAFVVDIGGGTSDFSIVRVSPERRRRPDRRSDVLATSGVHIGGTDFDRLLDLRLVMPHLGMGSPLNERGLSPPVWWFHDLATWQRINFMYEPAVAAEMRRVRRVAMEPDKLDRLLRVVEGRKGHALLAAVEQAKISLSEAATTVLKLEELAGIADLAVSRAELESAIGRALDRVTDQLQATLAAAQIAPAAIDAVFLTGGSSRLPLLRSRVRAAFPDAAMVEGDAFGSVATGLTIDALNRFGP